MDELKKYKLQRKNKYYDCIGKGVIFLTSVLVISGVSCLVENMDEKLVIEIFENETCLVSFITTTYGFIKTLPETKKIIKIKKQKLFKKTK